MKPFTHFIKILTVSILIFHGCDTSDKDIDVKRREENITIAVIPKGTIHEFAKSVHAGAIRLPVKPVWK